nr:PAAR domain-containing protein [Paraburkholderia tropica]
MREGNTTSHGGKVLACNVSHIIHGKPLALIGNMVSCPRCGGV